LSILFTSLWPGLVIWSVLYVSDYAFTITCARLYRSGVNEILVFEGSFELTPYYQRDIDSLKLISPRFIAMLFISGLLLAWIWFLASQSAQEFYVFMLGFMVLLELAIHVRHVRNLFTFRMLGEPGSVRGRIEYPRPFILRSSSIELFAFSGLFLLLSGFTQSWFVFGGAASCALTALKHRQLARRLLSNTSTAQPQTSS
jgi:hypothetical protein